MKENDLSEKIVISTGRIVSWPCVRALNSLQNAMMLIPCGPRAVPTGGAGFALPAGICSLTNPTAFFAMLLLYVHVAPPTLGFASDSHGVFNVVVVPDGALLASSAAPRKGHHPRSELIAVAQIFDYQIKTTGRRPSACRLMASGW